MNCFLEILNARGKKKEKKERKSRFIFNFSSFTPCLMISDLLGKLKYQSKPPSPTNTLDKAEHS